MLSTNGMRSMSAGVSSSCELSGLILQEVPDRSSSVLLVLLSV
jgi:hypothetical protein